MLKIYSGMYCFPGLFIILLIMRKRKLRKIINKNMIAEKWGGMRR